MNYKLKDIQFSEMVDYNVKVKQNKVKLLAFSVDASEVLKALKGNKFFRLVKSLTMTQENKGFFVTGKNVHDFSIKRLGNMLTFSTNGKTYYIEVSN